MTPSSSNPFLEPPTRPPSKPSGLLRRPCVRFGGCGTLRKEFTFAFAATSLQSAEPCFRTFEREN
ncbi:uncharacterized protein P884DRAFT_254976 [Thermothelomyces heterothallicus CBS 202.75]|uniref:uncharacterized protein n=1 Tax=Thermothelomyces heterothallicus CBS 202.75 TaxID=1149848 RepID=UPI003744626F